MDKPEFATENEASKTIVEGILKKDFAVFKNYARDESTFARFKGIVGQRIAGWEKADGPVKSFRIADTALARWTDQPETVTGATLMHEKGIHRFKFH
jgi:hypothetical protein